MVKKIAAQLFGENGQANKEQAIKLSFGLN